MKDRGLTVAGLGHLVPGAGEVAERLGRDQPGLFGDLTQAGYGWRRAWTLVL